MIPFPYFQAQWHVFKPFGNESVDRPERLSENRGSKTKHGKNDALFEHSGRKRAGRAILGSHGRPAHTEGPFGAFFIAQKQAGQGTENGKHSERDKGKFFAGHSRDKDVRRGNDARSSR
jgi:hypothetical protein